MMAQISLGDVCGPVVASDLLRVVVKAMFDAQRVALLVRRRHRLPLALKEDRTVVTAADLAVQAVIAGDLRRHDVEVRIVGEEEPSLLLDPEHRLLLDAVLGAVETARPEKSVAEVHAAVGACSHDASADEYWTLDPIDGTKGFIRGQHFSIALARIRSGAVVFAALACPTLEMLPTADVTAAVGPGPVLLAFQDRGTWQVNTAMADAPATRMRLPSPAARPSICESVEAAHSDHAAITRIARAIGALPETSRVDGQTKYALVARGQVDAYVRVPCEPWRPDATWDHAAGSLVAQEAGALVTDLFGNPLDFAHGRRLETNRGVVCAHPEAHRRLLTAVTADRAR